jgi:S-adenosylmethionine decarboxylase
MKKRLPKNLEPGIYRQRLILEGHYAIQADGETIRAFLKRLSKVLDMDIFAGPFAWPPDRWTVPEIELAELNGFVAWTDSGAHMYAWRSCRFFTVDLYSCKKFSARKVIAFARKFLKSKDMIHLEV